MRDRPYKIMLVESDPATIEVLAGSLSRRFRATVSCAVDAGSCLEMELVEPHDLAVVDLGTAGGMRLVRHLRSLSLRPVILTAEHPTYRDAVAGLRLGVRDLFKKPFSVEKFLDAARLALREGELSQQRAVKYRRMRDLVRRMIRERRELSLRVDFVCRDLVAAQRNLLHRVVAVDKKRAHEART